MRTYIIFFMLVAVTSFGQSIRPVTQWNDINKLDENYYQSKITWFAGDSLQMDVYARNGRDAIAFDGAAFPVLYIAARTNPAQVYTVATGIVVNATAGHVRVSSYSSDLPVSPGIDYSLWMAVLRPASGTVEVNTVAYSAVNVLTSPPGATYTNLPPGTAPFQFTLGSVAIPDSYSNAVEQRIVLAHRTASNAVALATVASNLAEQAYPASNPSGYVSSAAGWSGRIATQDVDLAGNSIENVRIIGGETGYLFDLEDGSIQGSLTFLNSPTIPGYLQTDGAYNLAFGTNAPVAWINPSLGPLSNAVAGAGAAATNQALAIGAGATNYANTVGAAAGLGATNFGLAIGAGATALVAQAAAQATNFSRAIGAGATNYANTVGAAVGLGATNFALQIGAGATALVAQAAAQGTNFSLAIGAGATSLVAGAAAQGTNFAFAIGRGATQLVAGASGAASNLSFAIGLGATQLVASASAAGTNFALSIGRGATQLVAVATANMATGGQWNAAIATATLNMATNDQWAGDVASAASGLGTGSVGSLSGYMPSSAVTGAITSLSFPLASGVNVSQRVAAVEGAGYAVNGQNITGRWVAAGNTVNFGGGDYSSFVGGGLGNEAGEDKASVVGGADNTAGGTGSFVGGGQLNTAGGSQSGIVSGDGNTTFGYASFIGGGSGNEAIGLYASIPGGYKNRATTNSFAAGVGAKATNSGSFVWSGPGDTNATFGSRADNSFNVRSVGGVFFLSSGLWIQDTNGNTIASFTPTNSTLSGTLNLTGYATTGAVNAQIAGASNLAVAVGAGATNFGLAIGAGATALVAQASAQSTNFARAIGAGNSNLTLAAYAVASNAFANAAGAGAAATNRALAIGAGATSLTMQAWATASNGVTAAAAALAAANGVGLTVTNGAGQWSQTATNDVDLATYGLDQAKWVNVADGHAGAAPTYSMVRTVHALQWIDNGGTNTMAHGGNLSGLGIQTVAGYNTSITNYARINPTGYSFPSAWNDSVGSNGDLVRSGTNMAFKSAGVWARWTVVTNW